MTYNTSPMSERRESASEKSGTRSALLGLLATAGALSTTPAFAKNSPNQAQVAGNARVINTIPATEQNQALPASFDTHPALEKLGDEVIARIIADYRTCIDENIEFVQTLDDPEDRADMTEYGEQHCAEMMEGDLQIAANKADMRDLTNSLIEQAKAEAGT
ncbi:MAG: hypothetical protein AAFP97_09480 [Pseudomonadota bacterium]